MTPSFIHHAAVAIMAAFAAFSVPSASAQELSTGAEDAIRGQLDEFSDTELKRFYLDCSHAAKRSLGTGDIAACSIGYELLLQRTFGGDFDALLDWSRQHPDNDTAAGIDDESTGTESSGPSP